MEGQRVQATNATLPASPSASPSRLPDSWVEKLFQKFEDFYGSKWAAQYGAFPRERVKATWAEELAGFAAIPDALASALEVQKTDEWPPTLPKFLGICRDQARRIGTAAKGPALEHKLTTEDIERNRQWIAEIREKLVRKMTAEAQAAEASE